MDDLRAHMVRCVRCREVDPEAARIAQPAALRRTVPAATFDALCPVGRSIYGAYLRWLCTPD